jgi:hypothetical protein
MSCITKYNGYQYQVHKIMMQGLSGIPRRIDMNYPRNNKMKKKERLAGEVRPAGIELKRNQREYVTHF